MAELERALPALLDTLAKGTGSAATIEQPQRRISSLSDKQSVASAVGTGDPLLEGRRP
jgi:hypothetical protein